MSEKVAVYPGSFDPFTNGHLDVVDRALSIFDRVVVAVAANPEKRQPLFTVEERIKLIEESLKSRHGVEVTSFKGLTVEFARSRGATTLIKGLRAYSDSSNAASSKLTLKVLIVPVDTRFAIAATEVESTPPEKNSPTGTSATRRFFTASARAPERRSASSSSGPSTGSRLGAQ